VTASESSDACRGEAVAQVLLDSVLDTGAIEHGTVHPEALLAGRAPSPASHMPLFHAEGLTWAFPAVFETMQDSGECDDVSASSLSARRPQSLTQSASCAGTQSNGSSQCVQGKMMLSAPDLYALRAYPLKFWMSSRLHEADPFQFSRAGPEKELSVFEGSFTGPQAPLLPGIYRLTYDHVVFQRGWTGHTTASIPVSYSLPFLVLGPSVSLHRPLPRLHLAAMASMSCHARPVLGTGLDRSRDRSIQMRAAARTADPKLFWDSSVSADICTSPFTVHWKHRKTGDVVPCRDEIRLVRCHASATYPVVVNDSVEIAARQGAVCKIVAKDKISGTGLHASQANGILQMGDDAPDSYGWNSTVDAESSSISRLASSAADRYWKLSPQSFSLSRHRRRVRPFLAPAEPLSAPVFGYADRFDEQNMWSQSASSARSDSLSDTQSNQEPEGGAEIRVTFSAAV